MNSNYPPLLSRIKSTTIDSLVVIAGTLLFSEILKSFDPVPNWVKIVLFALLLTYEPLCTAFGATIGNDKMKIRVRQNTDTSKRINLAQALVRYFFKIILGWFSFITMFSTEKRRAIHDIISGSVVIEID